MSFRIGLVLVLSLVSIASAANILGVFTSHSPSHLIIQMRVVNALIDRGHNVTVLTTIPLKDTRPRLRHIHLNLEKKYAEGIVDKLMSMAKAETFWERTKFFLNHMLRRIEFAHAALNAPEYLAFIREDNHFDAMILGYFLNELQLGIAAHFQCPAILMWNAMPVDPMSQMVGKPVDRSMVPHPMMGAKQPMSFKERAKNELYSFMTTLLIPVLYFPMKSYYEMNFPPDKYPSYDEVRKNVSLVLWNHHFSEGPIMPNVPAIIEIGGIQIKDKTDPLPEDLDHFLGNSSEHGTIFFSLGSNVKNSNVSPDRIRLLYKVFSSLKQNVIWKYDGDVYPGNSSNILFKSWLPQDDILAHPNTKLFITHGGKGSVVESEYHAVPMIAMPLFNEQYFNAKNIVERGFGLSLDFTTMSEKDFKDAVLQVLYTPKYSENVKRFSEIYRDRPQTAKETAVFWVEYVIRHKGAPHMQSPLVHLHPWQEHNLDVFVVFFASLYVSFKLMRVLFKLLRIVITHTAKQVSIKSKVE